MNFAVWRVGYRIRALGFSVVAADFWITLRVQGPKYKALGPRALSFGSLDP